MNFAAVKKTLQEQGIPSYRFSQLITAINQGKLPLWPKSISGLITNSWVESNILASKDGTQKATLTLTDGKVIETVLIEPKPGHISVCVSCEVGCPMNCAFCATGKMGFTRKLSSEEITDQVLFWIQQFPQKKINSIVFMGMGEPFHNTENVFSALDDLMELYGFGARHLSVSTCGIPEGIQALQKNYPQVNLAISLHSTIDSVRESLMPITKTYPLSVLKPILKANRRQLMFEYLLIKDVNDRDQDRDALVAWLADFDQNLIHVNLIRYNQTYGNFHPVTPERVRAWKEQLISRGISTSIRKNLGVDIAGACGQLATKTRS